MSVFCESRLSGFASKGEKIMLQSCVRGLGEVRTDSYEGGSPTKRRDSLLRKSLLLGGKREQGYPSANHSSRGKANNGV